MTAAHLHLQLPGGAERRVELRVGVPVVIGSGPQAELRVAIRGLAPAHCRLTWTGVGMLLVPLSGRTLVDGQAIVEPAAVRRTSVVELVDAFHSFAVIARLELGGAPPLAPARPRGSEIDCPRCQSRYLGTRAQVHWRDRHGDPELLVCPTCKDNERLQSLVIPGYEGLGPLRKRWLGLSYAARHLASGARIELLALTLERDPSPLIATLRERARQRAALRHPSVAALRDIIPREDGVTLAFEAPPGPTLAERVKALGLLGPDRVAELLGAALEVLEEARGLGLCHGELDPEGLALGDAGEVQMQGFLGLGDALFEFEADPGREPSPLRALNLYLAPEVLRGDPTNHRADLYSLAATLRFALTGALPVRASSLRSLFQALEEGEAPAAAELDPGVPQGLSEVLAKMMRRRPERRIATAAEALEALREGS